jgi:pyruvate, water dikinase
VGSGGYKAWLLRRKAYKETRMTEIDARYTVWYDEVDGKDFALVGKENANLGEMTKAGVRVSPGFCVTVRAHEKFIEANDLKNTIGSYLEELGPVTYETTKKASEYSMGLVESSTIPSDIQSEILAGYRKLCEVSHISNVPVAIRSSVPISMPGEMGNYLNVQGEGDLISCIKKCWGSVYEVEAITYRANKGMSFLFHIGVGVPKMVKSRVSGVVSTVNPLNGDPSMISVQASYGLGDAVVRGLVGPDSILIDKATGDIVKSVVGSKEIECVESSSGSDVVQVTVPAEMRGKLSLEHEEINELVRLAKVIEDYYGRAYEIEFGIDRDLDFPRNIIVLQVRPESVWSRKEGAPQPANKGEVMDRVLGQILTSVRGE